MAGFTHLSINYSQPTSFLSRTAIESDTDEQTSAQLPYSGATEQSPLSPSQRDQFIFYLSKAFKENVEVWVSRAQQKEKRNKAENILSQTFEDVYQNILSKERSELFLDLSDLNLRDLPDRLSLLQGIYSLDLSGNDFDALPHIIADLGPNGNHTGLQELMLNNNPRLVNGLPSWLFNLPLDVIQITNTQLYYIPPSIEKWSKNLTELSLTKNRIQVLPKEIGSLKCLTTLHLADNKINKLPTELGRLNKLEYLNLTGNPLKNALPKELLDLPATCEIALTDHNGLRERVNAMIAQRSDQSSCPQFRWTLAPPDSQTQSVLARTKRSFNAAFS